jgi:hypothetical protein
VEGEPAGDVQEAVAQAPSSEAGISAPKIETLANRAKRRPRLDLADAPITGATL